MLDKFLRNLIHMELPLCKNVKITFLDALLAVCITFAAVQIRIPLFQSELADPAAVSLRMTYCVLDAVLALLMAFWVWKISGSKLKTLGVYAVAVIWPVFAANSALVGGFEVRNAVLLLVLLVIIVMSKKYTKDAVVFFAVAVSVLQITQADKVLERLTNYWPNIYKLIDDVELLREYQLSGKLFVIGALMMVLYYLSKKKIDATPKLLVSLGLFLSLFISYFYPFMNYRSGYLANVLAILLFFCDRRKFYQPMLLCVVSYVSLSYYYAQTEVGPAFWIYAVILLVLLLDMGRYVYTQLCEGKQE